MTDSNVPGPDQWRTNHRWENLNQARLLTFSCYHRYQLFGRDSIRDAFVDALAAAREKHQFLLLAYVVMPEHVHLLIVPRPILEYVRGRVIVSSNSTVSDILWGLKKPFSQRVLARWTRLRAPILPRLALADGSRRF